MILRSKMLRWTTAVSISLFLAGSILAQVPTSTSPTGTAAAKHTKSQKGRPSALQQAISSLTLTADQKSKITTLAADYHNETKDKLITPTTRRAKSKQLLKDVNALLTPEQQAKFKLAMARVSGPMAGAARELKLTPAQRVKVMPIAQKANEDIAKLNADKGLKGKPKRDKIQSIVKTAVASIKANGGLTAEQKTKLDTVAAKIGQRGKGKGAGTKVTTTGAIGGAAK